VSGVLVLLTALFYGLLARYNYTVHPKNGTIICLPRNELSLAPSSSHLLEDGRTRILTAAHHREEHPALFITSGAGGVVEQNPTAKEEVWYDRRHCRCFLMIPDDDFRSVLLPSIKHLGVELPKNFRRHDSTNH
jgi:hypothetical protein